MSASLKQHADIPLSFIYNPGSSVDEVVSLINYEVEDHQLHLNVATRKLSESLTIRDRLIAEGVTRKPAKHKTVTLADSWALRLTCYVLLPVQHALCCQQTQGDAGMPWNMGISALMEPSDISGESLRFRLEALVESKLPSLAEYGTMKLVGLGHRSLEGAWEIIGLLDLREVHPELVTAGMQKLTPSNGIAAWGFAPLVPASTASPGNLPHNFDTLLEIVEKLGG